MPLCLSSSVLPSYPPLAGSLVPLRGVPCCLLPGACCPSPHPAHAPFSPCHLPPGLPQTGRLAARVLKSQVAARAAAWAAASAAAGASAAWAAASAAARAAAGTREAPFPSSKPKRAQRQQGQATVVPCPQPEQVRPFHLHRIILAVSAPPPSRPLPPTARVAATTTSPIPPSIAAGCGAHRGARC